MEDPPSVKAEGCVIVTVLETGTRLESVTVTVYVPAHNPVIFCVVADVLQRKVNGGVPPKRFAVADPLHCPLHKGPIPDVETLKLPQTKKSERINPSPQEIISPLTPITISKTAPVVGIEVMKTKFGSYW